MLGKCLCAIGVFLHCSITPSTVEPLRSLQFCIAIGIPKHNFVGLALRNPNAYNANCTFTSTISSESK